ncbi:MAG: NAD(P)-dependent oxidoreductase [Acidobacteriaceae bacterium]|nr:NAD(P)-dependent oxidoreductase [Acidobacteriaceae bacterium]
MRTRWLITGAQGFVARYATSCILQSSPDAVVLGIGRSERLDGWFSHRISSVTGRIRAPLPPEISHALDQRYEYKTVDVRVKQQVRSILSDFQPQFVLHLASCLRGDPRPQLLRSNIEGTVTLLQAVSEVRAEHPKVVVGSSGGVYGVVPSERLPIRETEPCEPVDEYSISKMAAEHWARLMARKAGIRLAIARIFNVIGPGQDERHIAGQVAAQLSALHRRGGGALKLGALDSTRDFIDVRDLAAAIVTIAKSKTSEGLINVGSGVERPVWQLVHELLSITKMDVPIETRSDGRIDVPRHYADITRLLASGFEPSHTFRNTLTDIWNYYQRVWPTSLTGSVPEGHSAIRTG